MTSPPPPRKGADAGESDADTRHRLLHAAGEVFAERGFREASIREITERAGTNVAAVNYHFRDKHGLYLSVIRQSHERALRMQSAALHDVSVGAEERLALFIDGFLRSVLGEAEPAVYSRLFTREMIDPTEALETFVEDEVRPKSALLAQLLGELLGLPENDRLVRMLIPTVISQVVFWHNCRPVLERMLPELTYSGADVDRISAHVTRFMLAGLRELRRELDAQR